MAKPTKQQIARWKENRRKWVEALRSGEFEQGQRRLFDGHRYCCLGVLCHLAGLKPVADDGEWLFEGETNIAPYTAMKFVGLSKFNGGYRSTRGWCWLTTLNDDNQPFSFLADIIESEPPGLFLESVEPSNV